MAMVDDMQFVDGTIEFRFVHDNAYEAVQNQFRIFVEMGDPQNLIGLLQRNRMFLTHLPLNPLLLNTNQHITFHCSSR